MTELALPVLGALFVFGILLPMAALISKLILRLLQVRGNGSGLHDHGALRYALLIGPTLGPLAWIISACLHQAEAGTAANVCVVYDPPGMLCPEVALFACALVLLVALTALPRIGREQRALRAARSPEAERLRARLERLAPRSPPDLSRMLAQLVIADHTSEPIATHGVLAPRIVVQTAFASGLDDAALLGALCHEAEHVRDRDPLRYFIAWWALAVNPIGRWLLGSELTRWIVAREAHCDRAAVLAGASAPALAQALVAAARFSPAAGAATPALRTADARVLRLRVDLLLAYAERRPHRCCRPLSLRLAACGFVLALALAHPFGEEPLNTLHRTTEDVATFITGMN
jgi:Zn-dependent protease with chaperone function